MNRGVKILTRLDRLSTPTMNSEGEFEEALNYIVGGTERYAQATFHNEALTVEMIVNVVERGLLVVGLIDEYGNHLTLDDLDSCPMTEELQRVALEARPGEARVVVGRYECVECGKDVEGTSDRAALPYRCAEHRDAILHKWMTFFYATDDVGVGYTEDAIEVPWEQAKAFLERFEYDVLLRAHILMITDKELLERSRE